MDVSLVMFKSDGKRQDFPLNKDHTIVGRKNNCDLRIPLSSVSRQHCEVVVQGQKLKIKDLGSSNGTFHNGNRIQESLLNAGDEITIGPVVFTVIVDGQPASIEPVRTIVSGKAAAEEVSANPSVSNTTDTQPLELSDEGEDQLDIPIDPEGYSPTVDIDDADDDPIAALERLAQANDDDDK